MDPNRKIPNLFIVGAPKCGTTSMVHYLDQHPDVFVSRQKEPHYFNEGSGHRYVDSEADYLQLFSGATTEAYRCEGSVWYLYSENAIDNILSFNPDAKFVVMLRNPIDMFFSLHQELLFGGSENVKSAAKAWDLQGERALGRKVPPGASDPSFVQYGAACKLGAQAQRASRKIAKENLLFVLLDDLISDPDATFRTVLAFLHVKQITLPSYEVMNVKKVRKSYLLSQFFIAITRLKKKFGIKGGLGLANRINAINVSHDVAISSEDKFELLAVLEQYFREDIALLETTINRDLSHWESA